MKLLKVLITYCSFANIAILGDINYTSVMLTGITGAGKSSACNFLLGEKIFEVDQGMMAVTTKSASHSTVLNSRKLEIIDTPGFCEDGVSKEQSINELGKAVVLARNGLHAIAIVINVSHRFTSSQVAFLEEIELFDELWPFMFIIFSAAKCYGHTDEEQRKVIYNTYNSCECPEHLKTLLNKVGKRFMMLESTEDSQIYRTKKLEEFFGMVDSIYHTNKRVYSNQLFKQAIILYEKQKEMEKKKEKEHKEELDTLAHQMNEEIKKLKAEKEKKVQLMREKLRQEKLQEEKRRQEKKEEEERQARMKQARQASDNAYHAAEALRQDMRATAAAARGNHSGIIINGMAYNSHTQSWTQAQSWGPSSQTGGDGCNIS